jgi:hypothetical protein
MAVQFTGQCSYLCHAYDGVQDEKKLNQTVGDEDGRGVLL